jgi:RimJ/RimL family protein N-acetyltransferase
MIPTLTTERLVLRPPVFADFDAYARLMASERAIHMGGPFDTRQAWGMFCSDTVQWHLFGHGCLMIERRADGVCLGQVGINHGPLFPERELGWLLYDGFEGHGYATEAAIALRDWAWAQGFPTLVSYCDLANAASIAVTQRLGGVRDDAAPKQDPEDLVFRYRP